MKASSKFLGAVAAVMMSLGLVLPVSITIDLAATHVAEAAVVRSIQVRGNSRVDADTIRSYIDIKPGKPFTGSDIDNAVKRLFSTGLFSDVRINQVGGTLVVDVDEYSVVNRVLFQGNKKIKDPVLASRVQLQPRGPFSQSMLEADADTIRESYRRIGRSDAVVTTQIIEVGDNRVNVVFDIQEGGRTKITTIDFIGNNAYSDGRLRDVISTKKSNFLSFLFREDIYDEDRLRADEEALRRFYYNHGYADFQIVSSNATLDDASNEYTVSFTVDEGERYSFGPITVESSLDGVDGDSLRSIVATREGKTYSAEKVEKSIVALSERVAENGYAFAQVTPRGDRDFANRTIAVAYYIDQGPRAYVERIEIRGNTRTRDYVIRREFDISEGDAFNQVMIQKAKKRLEELDFFDSVDISTVPGSDADQVVLVVDVKEKNTGEFSIGAGYSTGGANPGPSIEGSVTERNFLGRGQYIKIAAGGGKSNRNYTLSFTEPYFLGRRISAGFDIFKQRQDYTNYTSDVIGGTVRFGLPITEALSTQLAYNLTSTSYAYTSTCDANADGIADATCTIPPAVSADVTGGRWIKSSVSGTVLYNTIDDMKKPRSGFYISTTGEVAGLGGNAKFVKLTGKALYYHTLNEAMDLVGLISVGGGHAQSLGTGGLRTYDLFQSSDRMIRGFAYNGIGPYDTVLGSVTHLGGTSYINANAEVEFPLPAFPESFGLRGAVFADAATVFGLPANITAASAAPAGLAMAWRASVGASVIWQSPFGPLRLDYAIPVLKQTGDKIQNFNFGVSGRF